MKIQRLKSKIIENVGLKPELIDGYWTFTKRKGEDFRILQLTDIHLGVSIFAKKPDTMAINAIISVVQAAKPDLIILTGDNIYPIPIFTGSMNNLRMSKAIGELLEGFGIPWAIVYGNHDCEPFAFYGKQKLSEYYSSLSNCLFQAGESDLTGDGNYIIKVNNEDGELNTALMLLDSNMYVTKSFFSGFDNIHDDQIEWYKREINKMSEGRALVPSLGFFHIPFREYQDAWKLFTAGNTDEVTYHFGEIGESNDYFGVPRLQGNMFEEMVKLGSMKGCFVGHDHLNTASYTYKGIRMTYGMSIDFIAYKNSYSKFSKYFSQRGGTIVSISDDASFEVSQMPLSKLL